MDNPKITKVLLLPLFSISTVYLVHRKIQRGTVTTSFPDTGLHDTKKLTEVQIMLLEIRHY